MQTHLQNAPILPDWPHPDNNHKHGVLANKHEVFCHS